MKKVLFTLLGIVVLNAAAFAEPKCYTKARDDFGNTYYARVPCPAVMIIKK